MYSSDEIKVTGGGQIGKTRATWPFINLIVNRDRLQLKASILGNFVFMPSDIISVVPDSSISLTGSSIRISHRVAAYPAHIVFQSSGSTADLISKINQTGFLSNTDPVPADISTEIMESRKSGAFPIKVPAAIAIIVIWNLFFLYDFRHLIDGSDKTFAIGGPGEKLALGFMMTLCVLLLISKPLSALVLKKGRDIDDIRYFLYFILVICTFLMTGVFLIPR